MPVRLCASGPSQNAIALAVPWGVQQNHGSSELKTGARSVDFSFSSHFRKRPTEVCGKFRNPRAHRPFHEKKSQVEVLPLASVVGMPGNCRILLDGRKGEALMRLAWNVILSCQLATSRI